MDEPVACPEVELLERFAAEDLDDATQRRIDTHLAECVDCRERMADVAANLGLVEPLRQISQPGPSEQAFPIDFGRYELRRELGRGGMGVVYEARQRSTQRTVALKVVNSQLTSPAALGRFAHESQALARLAHPGIAQIFDADTFDAGRGPQPYFAMELIRGADLRTHCRLHPREDARQIAGPTVRERLLLVARVCDAVQHAHQKGVIHRDLKPGNILVDDAGNPKILDFGVARVTNSDFHEATRHTLQGELLGTVPYMSPEQVSGDPDALDTCTDVYSLGVILFEVLSGVLPYDLNRNSLLESAETIRDAPPRRLGALDRRLQGDIETIVAKTLSKDKSDRYESAAALAADLRRYLNHEPIAARPPSVYYQVRKFAARNRVVAAAISIVLATLTLGIAMTSWQAVRATRAERDRTRQLGIAEAAQARAETNELKATREADKFKEVNAFLQNMLATADPGKTPENPQITVREAVDRAVARLAEGDFASRPEIEAALRTTVGNTYLAVGAYESAATELRRAVELHRHEISDSEEGLAFALNKLGRVEQELGRFADAEARFRESLAICERVHGPEHDQTAKVLNNLGYLMERLGKLEEGEKLLRDSLAMRRRLDGGASTEIATTLNNLAVLVNNLGRAQDAERLFRESLAMDRELRGDLHPNVAATMSNLASLLMNRRGGHEEAEQLARQALDLTRQMMGDSHPRTLIQLNNLALCLRKKGDLDEAETALRECLEVNRRIRGERHAEVATVLHNLAWLLVQRGAFDEAELMHREALDIRRESLGDTHIDTLLAKLSLARLHLRRGEPLRGEPLFAECVDAVSHTLPEGHWMIAFFHKGHGECLIQLARYEEAEQALTAAYELLENRYGPDHPDTAKVFPTMVELYEAWGKPAEASTWQVRLNVARN